MPIPEKMRLRIPRVPHYLVLQICSRQTRPRSVKVESIRHLGYPKVIRPLPWPQLVHAFDHDNVRISRNSSPIPMSSVHISVSYPSFRAHLEDRHLVRIAIISPSTSKDISVGQERHSWAKYVMAVQILVSERISGRIPNGSLGVIVLRTRDAILCKVMVLQGCISQKTTVIEMEDPNGNDGPVSDCAPLPAAARQNRKDACQEQTP
mmetsp:Transcript_55974/g.137481  ORF Transcript_55974/g.137481 Transcript_55974/m.137481 type:complete len:207 (-) Transcript_55974:229-849(-)